MFTCEICSVECCNQIKFFEHLKLHYEGTSNVLLMPNGELEGSIINYEDSLLPQTFTFKDSNEEVEDANITCGLCGKLYHKQKTFEAHFAQEHQQVEEFSEPEDMMEGIRHVVNIQTESPEERIEDKFKNWEYPTTDPLQISTPPPNENAPLVLKTTYLDNDEFDEPGTGKRRKKLTQCPHCPRMFLHRNSLMYHIRSHTGKRPHQCEVCGKGFYTANTLKVHMRMHSGDKPYKCEVCGRRFRQWGDLKYHMTSLHSDSKQYQCEFCGKNFARKYSLIIHCRIHTGERNYICEFCNKSFRASSYLLNHRRIHTGEKPYSCDVCGKSFRVRSDMKRHRTTHNKELNFINSQKLPDIPDNTVNTVTEHVGDKYPLEDKACSQFQIQVLEEITEASSW
ncbi:zinc finger protein 567-like [Cimex lectularius]|uniref:C2H2-type domain-containing protein n=1 Tax=Cimex lectularius TaxID=79782 RepID=A0A8I6R923_CIMLE|nr:zinc finger protein 567-like [Cimex lectularius]